MFTSTESSSSQNLDLNVQGTKYHPDKFGLLSHHAQLKDGNAVALHSEVGSAHSVYLRRKYGHELARQGIPPILVITELIEYDANAVRRMVNFFYTGVLPCSLAEIPELLALCSKLQVPSVKAIIEKFIIQKAAEPNCLLDCWNIACHKDSELSSRTKDLVLGYVISNLEQVVLDQRFAQLDQAAVETLLQRNTLPVRSEADVLRIALMYFLRRRAHTNVQSLLNVVRYNCSEDVIIRMRQDVESVEDEMVLHCFEQNCAYGLWQVNQLFPDNQYWPLSEMLPPRGRPDADCDWIVGQLAYLTVQTTNLTIRWFPIRPVDTTTGQVRKSLESRHHRPLHRSIRATSYNPRFQFNINMDDCEGEADF